MIDINTINAKDYEFSGDELGELLLSSVRQMKNGEVSRAHSIAVSEVVQARQSVGLSQQDFATLLGVSVRTLQAWEQGKRNPSKGAATLLKIATKHPQVLLSVL